MEDFLNRLSHKAFQNRKVAIIENGSWAPTAARTMKSMLDGMKNLTVCENTVTVLSTMKEKDVAAMEQLADELLCD